MVMEKLFRLMADKKASDLFFSTGAAIHIKIIGNSMPLYHQKLDGAAIRGLLGEILTEQQWAEFDSHHELNLGHELPGVGGFRLNVFMQRSGPGCVIRFIPNEIPPPEALNLPKVLQELVMEKRGLVLVVGATGSGKSTTLASMLDYRNENKSGHILTFEDPIEFAFKSKRSIVNQRQIGTDTKSLAAGLKNAMRQAPDCILIGEIRDMESMSHAIAYAQSGHLVLATLHANNANNALNRIVSFYTPENRQVLLSDLSSTLKGIVSQRLINSLQGGRIPAVEVLLNSRHVAELIEKGDLDEVKEAMEKSLVPGSKTFEQALMDLVRDELVSRDEALAQADSPTHLLWLLENAGLANAVPTDPGKRKIKEEEPEEGTSFTKFLIDT
ncbi:MAG: PilT/PilU family type 4a pilus ATPase [Quisquiliibacterium sp.]